VAVAELLLPRIEMGLWRVEKGPRDRFQVVGRLGSWVVLV
jgi:hypothetical protein